MKKVAAYAINAGLLAAIMYSGIDAELAILAAYFLGMALILVVGAIDYSEKRR